MKFKTTLYPVLPILGIILYTILVIIMIFDSTQRIALYSALSIITVINIGITVFPLKEVKVLNGLLRVISERSEQS